MLTLKLGEGFILRFQHKSKRNLSEDQYILEKRDIKRKAAESNKFKIVFTVLTWIMKLDLLLFGHMRAGPFFVLLKKEGYNYDQSSFS